jgi:cathepsin L
MAVALAAAAPVASSQPPKADELTMAYTFEQYVQHFQKEYDSAAFAEHKAIFEQNKRRAIVHNQNPDATYTKGINQFTDMSAADLKRFKGKKRTGEQVLQPSLGFMRNLEPVENLPKEVSWLNVSTPVKNQGGCGSCWAFSTTEVLESHTAIASGKLLDLAPQQLVSCMANPDDCGGKGGCQGATQWLGFNYTQTSGGLSLSTDYPYRAQTGVCDKSAIKPAASNKGYVRLPANDYTALMNAVAKIGPIAISVDAGWSDYEGGVYKGTCGTTIDHAVVLSGYGTDPKGGDYYLVRNSWGANWGEKGYIRIARHADDATKCGMDKNTADGTECKDPKTGKYPTAVMVGGLCVILSDSSYPTGAHLV